MSARAANPVAPGYYVSAVYYESRWLASGPYPTHRAALDAIEEVRREAEREYPRSRLYAWGTAKRGLGRKAQCDCIPPCLSLEQTRLMREAESGAILPKTHAGRQALALLRAEGLVRKARVFVLTPKGRARLKVAL